MPGYEKSDHVTINEKLTSGQILINISTTCFSYKAIIRTLSKIIEDLNEMVI